MSDAKERADFIASLMTVKKTQVSVTHKGHVHKEELPLN